MGGFHKKSWCAAALGSNRSATRTKNFAAFVGAMATFEDVFVRPELYRWLGGFLGANPAGLRLQCLVFRASRSLAGDSDRMRLHCLRCLWRWEMAPAGFLARDSSDVVAALMAHENLSVDIWQALDLALFG